MVAKRALRMSRATVGKMGKLIHMEYKPAELAKEILLSVKTVYRYIEVGAPHRTDKAGNIWIVGTDFREWAVNSLTVTIRHPKISMGENQAWCVRCLKPVEFIQTASRKRAGATRVIFGTCPICGCKVTRFSKA